MYLLQVFGQNIFIKDVVKHRLDLFNKNIVIINRFCKLHKIVKSYAFLFQNFNGMLSYIFLLLKTLYT